MQFQRKQGGDQDEVPDDEMGTWVSVDLTVGPMGMETTTERRARTRASTSRRGYPSHRCYDARVIQQGASLLSVLPTSYICRNCMYLQYLATKSNGRECGSLRSLIARRTTGSPNRSFAKLTGGQSLFAISTL